MELLLHCLGGGGVSRADPVSGLDGCGAGQWQGATVDDSTSASTSSAGHSSRGRGDFAGRLRVCRWQADEVSQKDAA